MKYKKVEKSIHWKNDDIQFQFKRTITYNKIGLIQYGIEAKTE